ncbi:hypothetical protein ACQ4WX_37305 [Streptomyces lasalocidi]
MTPASVPVRSPHDTGRPGAGVSGTAHGLAVRHRLLLLLSGLLTLCLFLSYEGVHGDAGPLRSASAPAVLSLDTALYALDEAQRDAGAAAPTSDFQKQISVAAQSLAAAAGDDIGGAAGRRGPPDGRRPHHRVRRQGPAGPTPARSAACCARPT